MIVFVCLDPDGGMLFHRRRQSSDRVVTEDIVNISRGCCLWVDPYSAGLFAVYQPDNMAVREGFLDLAGPGEYCFVENRRMTPYVHNVEKLIVYRWDKVYPKDMMFDLNLADWELESTVWLTGHSHENIAKETYLSVF